MEQHCISAPRRIGRGLARLALAWAALAPALAHAVPHVPARDDEVVEQLRDRPLDGTDRALRVLRAQLHRDPDRLSLAVAVAQRCIAVARRDGDPRYVGYAEAALGPWWALAQPPEPVRLLRAIILQGVHEFEPATRELDALLRDDPRNAQAWLTRASILQAQGRYAEAADSCRRLGQPGTALYAEACLAELQSLTGDPPAALAQLERLRRDHPEQAAWLSLIEAELADRIGDARAAEERYRAALAASPDAYTKGAYADALLDHGRAAEVIALLQSEQRADPLLLRLALAYQACHDPRLDGALQALQGRFDAARLRGDTVHLREEARFELELRHRPDVALALAQRNWVVQKEPADARLLLAAARAAGRSDAAAPVREFVAANHLADVRLAEYLP